jgi:outer membrane immunogenic protein
MKKINLIVALLVVGASAAFAQGTLGKGGKQLNAGLGFSSWGIPVYVGVDFGVHESITVGPRISYRKTSESFSGFEYSQSLTVISFNGNYHFNQLLDLPEPFDLYAGLTLGYYIWSDVKWSNGSFSGDAGEASGIGIDAQIGARYFFSDKFGLNLELGGGTASGGNFGITYKF